MFYLISLYYSKKIRERAGTLSHLHQSDDVTDIRTLGLRCRIQGLAGDSAHLGVAPVLAGTLRARSDIEDNALSRVHERQLPISSGNLDTFQGLKLRNLVDDIDDRGNVTLELRAGFDDSISERLSVAATFPILSVQHETGVSALVLVGARHLEGLTVVSETDTVQGEESRAEFTKNFAELLVVEHDGTLIGLPASKLENLSTSDVRDALGLSIVGLDATGKESLGVGDNRIDGIGHISQHFFL